MEGPRGRLISDSDLVEAVKLIKEAVDSGARLRPACAELNISAGHISAGLRVMK